MKHPLIAGLISGAAAVAAKASTRGRKHELTHRLPRTVAQRPGTVVSSCGMRRRSCR
jgi:hypothetical protein